MAQTTNLQFENVITDMRKSLNVFWDFSGEVGMVYLVAEIPDEDVDTQQYRGLEKYTPDLTPGSREADVALAQTFFPHLIRFFQEATLDPGEYDVPLIHLKDPQIGGLLHPLRHMKYLQIPFAEKMRFNVTREHLILLKHLKFEEQGGLLSSHAKRPYGDQGYFALDMAEYLDDPGPEGPDGYFSKERDARYEQLHEEMFLVVLVFWTHARL